MRRSLTPREKRAMLQAQGYVCGCGCGRVICWDCGMVQFEHGLAVGLGNDQKPDSAWLPLCHKPKTARDVKAIRKADRAGRKHRGEHKPKGRKLQGRSFRGWRAMDGSVRWKKSMS